MSLAVLILVGRGGDNIKQLDIKSSSNSSSGIGEWLPRRPIFNNSFKLQAKEIQLQNKLLTEYLPVVVKY